MSIGERIKKIRQEKGYTQQELAEMIGVAKNTITGYEKGNREPDATKIIALSKALNVPGDWIIGNKDSSYSYLSVDALIIASEYDALDEYGKSLVRLVIDHEAKRVKLENGHESPSVREALGEPSESPAVHPDRAQGE